MRGSHPVELSRSWTATWLAGGALLVLLIPTTSCSQRTTDEWRPCALLQSEAIDECSGIIKSRKNDGVFWVHNDSGDEARLFAIDRRGRLLCEVIVDGAENVDWEDLATDDSGHLFVGDFGNNRNKRRDLCIYVLEEPRISVRQRAQSLHVPLQRRIPFYFPEQHAFPDPEGLNFDCESLCWYDGWLYVLTKHRSDTRTVLYRLPADGEEERAAERLGEAEIGSMVTAADLSRDGRKLALLSYEFIYIFERPKEGDNYLAGRFRRILIEGRQCEGICFDGDDLLFSNEQREIYCLSAQFLERESTYLPEAPRISLSRLPSQPGGAGLDWSAMPLLPLRPELVPPGEPAGEAPAVQLAWSEAGLHLRARWVDLDGLLSEAPQPLLYVMFGPGDPAKPELDEEHQIFECVLEAGEFRLQRLRPDDGREPRVSAQSQKPLEVELLLPHAGSGELRPGSSLRLNVLAMQPSPGGESREWSWAGSSSTQPFANPLLWGRADLLAGH